MAIIALTPEFIRGPPSEAAALSLDPLQDRILWREEVRASASSLHPNEFGC